MHHFSNCVVPNIEEKKKKHCYTVKKRETTL